jgi:hypothetical protein
MKRFIKSKKGLALLATLVVAAAAAIGGYAYFLNSGSASALVSGSQVGSAGSSTFAIATVPGNTTYNQGTALMPTATTSANAVVATVPFTVTNTDEATELLSSYTVSIDPTWATSSGCSASWFKLGSAATGSPYTNSSLHVQLAPNSDGVLGGDQYSGTVTVELVNADTDQTACQGTFPQLAISASSS